MIGIVAPSNKVPSVELKLGLRKAREAGLDLQLHPQCRKHDFLFAGTDEERAHAFFEYANDPRLAAIWCARGGYGAGRLLPLLEQMAAKRGVPRRRLLLGYSDATILLEYVRTRWGWATLHAPMPGMRKFCLQSGDEWESLLDFIRGERRAGIRAPWEKRKLRFIGAAPKSPIEGELVGGNLTVWTSLVGTPYAGRARDKILFLEDVDEGIYRLDRMLQQLRQSGGLHGVRAILLGNFLSCADGVAKVLTGMPGSEAELRRMLLDPRPEELKPLRKKYEAVKAIHKLFGDVTAGLGIPVAYELPVGHGPGIASLPLGARYKLGKSGQLELLHWDWIGDPLRVAAR